MIRSSFSLLSRAARQTAALNQYGALAGSSSVPAAANAIARGSYARHYSEASTRSQTASESEGAEAASSAKPDQQSNAKAPADETAKKLEAKEKEAAQFKDKFLRAVADFENLQKMTQREKQQAKDYAIQKFAQDLIGNLDILHLAMNSVPADRRAHATAADQTAGDDRSHLADLFIGVSMTAKELEKTLSRYDVKSFDPTGEKFDPNVHEALYQAPIPGKEAGTVLECQKKGWMLKDRLLRAAQVGVVAESG